MNVTISNYAGFCPGVKRADTLIERLIAEARPGDRVYTLGNLIHNRLYNESLAERGVYSVKI